MKYVLVFIMALFIFVGCSKNTSNTNNNVNDNSDKTTESNVVESKKIDLQSDDEKIVFQISNMKYVFYYIDNNITGFETYIDYNSNEIANKMIENINAENIDKLYVKDNYVVIKWNQSEYENMSLEDIKKSYSYMFELIK